MAIFTGTANDDIFTGGVDNDVARGFGGADSLSGSGGSDILAGGSGADLLDGGDGPDSLYSGEESPSFNLPYYSVNWTAPVLDTGSEVDTLNGGAGDDRLFAGYGDNVNGGGNDSQGDYLYISFLGAPAGVTVDFRSTSQVIGGGTISGIENISWVQGSNFDDTLNVASSVANGYSDFTAVFGMGGADNITAGYYTGTLFGGDGNDVLDGRPSGYMQLVDGGAGDDVIYTPTNSFASADGGDGNDTIYSHGQTHGGAGNDLIVLQYSYYAGLVWGDDGDDEIRASFAGHTISGGNGADILTGSTGVDKLYSGNFIDGTPTSLPGVGRTATFADDMQLDRDVLSGGAANDILAAGYGDDIDGGADSDTLYLSLGGLGAGTTFSTAGIVSGQPFTLGGGVIRNIEILAYVRGTNFADTITAATQSSLLTIDAADGDDVVYSNNSSVTLSGGAGNDRLVSGAAGDIFDGGAGVDTIDYSLAKAATSVDLTAGTGGGGDALSNVENVVGGAFSDTILGSAASNVLEGGGGDDMIDGRGGADTASYAGATAAVSVRLSQVGAQATGGAGNDTLVSIEHLIGSAFGDTLSGDAGANQLYGLAGDDLLDGAMGDDILDGGAGVDTASYAGVPGAVTVDLRLTGPQSTGGAGIDTLTSIENLVGSVFADTLTGNLQDNVLTGGLGDDILDGGSGFDTASYATAASAVNVNLKEGKATGGAGVDTLKNIEAAIGSAFGDSLTSNSAGSKLYGLAGDDVFYFGHTQFELMYVDTFDGGEGLDMVSLASETSAVTANLSTGHIQTPRNDATLVNIEGLIGSAYSDTLTGDGRINVLIGGDGDDVLDGGEGDDRLYGGIANDTYYVDRQGDLVFEAAGEGTDTVVTASNFYLYDNLEVMTLAATAGDIFGVGNALANTITGNSGANLLLGGGGADVIRGGDGDDQLFGEDGNDMLEGGMGADILVGGAGDDNMSGSEGADRLYGGEGNDFLAGGIGGATDILVGGAGNDVLAAVAGGEQDLLDGGAGNDTYVVDAADDLTFEAADGGTDTVQVEMNFGGYYLYANVENLTLAGAAASASATSSTISLSATPAPTGSSAARAMTP
jgi:Ca2+-binding RTX toxin-like protein